MIHKSTLKITIRTSKLNPNIKEHIKNPSKISATSIYIQRNQHQNSTKIQNQLTLRVSTHHNKNFTREEKRRVLPSFVISLGHVHFLRHPLLSPSSSS
jgi:ribosomal protein L14E/L6E/L27E